jgi:nucleotide-binding universal stress UspA family protein
MFKSVIWATDGSAAADEALVVATQMAGEAGGKILAIHVVELTMPGKAGEGSRYTRTRTSFRPKSKGNCRS